MSPSAYENALHLLGLDWVGNTADLIDLALNDVTVLPCPSVMQPRSQYLP